MTGHNIPNQIFQDFHKDSRVWIYQADRWIQPEEKAEINNALKQFTERWVSHNRQLRAGGVVLHNRFIVLMVDESHAGASGCSIDASIHFLQELGKKLDIDWFDRQQFAFYNQDNEVEVLSSDAFAEAYGSGSINSDTLVFDHLVKTKGSWKTGWVKPLQESWHMRLL